MKNLAYSQMIIRKARELKISPKLLLITIEIIAEIPFMLFILPGHPIVQIQKACMLRIKKETIENLKKAQLQTQKRFAEKSLETIYWSLKCSIEIKVQEYTQFVKNK